MCYNFGASMSAASSSASTTPAAPPSSTYSGEYDGCSSSESDSEVVSLLDRLKSPAPVAIVRSRKIRTNLPPHPWKTSVQRSTLLCSQYLRGTHQLL